MTKIYLTHSWPYKGRSNKIDPFHLTSFCDRFRSQTRQQCILFRGSFDEAGMQENVPSFKQNFAFKSLLWCIWIRDTSRIAHLLHSAVALGCLLNRFMHNYWGPYANPSSSQNTLHCEKAPPTCTGICIHYLMPRKPRIHLSTVFASLLTWSLVGELENWSSIRLAIKACVLRPFKSLKPDSNWMRKVF